MQIGVIGLGRMGANIARRLMKHGHTCVVFDKSKDAVEQSARQGGAPAKDLADLVKQLAKPRAVWVMLPAGAITDETVIELKSLMDSDDVVIDGGNSFYRDDIRRAAALKERGIHYCDVGTSGGVWGFERGYCMMIGGERDVFSRLDPIFAALAPGEGDIEPTPERKTVNSADQGYLYCGPVGSGHFVKMIHNGIEYGIMEAFAEGFDILKAASSTARAPEERYALELADIAEVWRRGSVISSWLLDLTAMALAEDESSAQFTGVVEDFGEGRWTVNAAIETGVPADVLSASLYARFRSRDDARFSNKLLSAMRNKFGGHVEPKNSGPKAGG